MSGFERLSGDYIRGYTKAIQDTIEIFDYVQDDLKILHNKNMTGKMARNLLKTILEEREKIREDCEGFIRFNKQKNGFEFFDGKDD